MDDVLTVRHRAPAGTGAAQRCGRHKRGAAPSLTGGYRDNEAARFGRRQMIESTT